MLLFTESLICTSSLGSEYVVDAVNRRHLVADAAVQDVLETILIPLCNVLVLCDD